MSSKLGRVILVTVALGGIAGCGAEPAGPPPPEAAKVVVGHVVKKAIIEWDEFVGRLEPTDTVEVRARVSGYLTSVRFEEGQLVNAGDLLFTIDARPFEAEVTRTKALEAEAQARIGQARYQLVAAEGGLRAAEARSELARKQATRFLSLMRSGGAAVADHDARKADDDAARAAVDQARARIEAARAEVGLDEASLATARANLGIANLNLNYTHVSAPISGKISQRLVTPGNLVTGGDKQATLLTTIVSLDPIHCVFDVDEQSYLKGRKAAADIQRPGSPGSGLPVFLALADEREFQHQGYVDFQDNRMDEGSATLRGRAIFSNPKLVLTPGLFARVRIPGRRHDAILVPDGAIGTDQAEKFVLVVGKDSKGTQKTVTLGSMSHGLRVVASGLDGTETIVVRGGQRVRPGGLLDPTTETIVPADAGLPDDVEPVSRTRWLPRQSSLTLAEKLTH